MKQECNILWFKNDLRLHDNESLCKAIADGLPVLPIFIFDSRLYDDLDLGFRKAGYNRFHFLRETVLELKENLKAIGGNLHIQYGIPEEIIPKLVEEYNVTRIYAEDEYAYEELQVLDALKHRLPKSCELHLTWGKTLYHIDDIPYAIEDIPKTSKTYRIHTGKTTEVRAPFLAPESISTIDDFPESHIPDFSTFNFKEDSELELYVKSGEKAALERLHHYTFETQQLTSYRWTRNRSLGMDYSSKFSPYLAVGAISPRLIFQKVKQYEELIKKNQSTWWLVFELVWRDYFTFRGMNVGNKMFKTEGFKGKGKDWENNKNLFQRWCDGQTGLPFIDAHMRQLNKTGFMSNRGRVNCASFLVYDYKVDWTWGAAYFENKLIDYDVSANWMNWHYQAYEIWYTNPIHQSLKYNSKEFIQKYVSELSAIDDNTIYLPWEYNIKAYPKPQEILGKWTRSINKIKKTME
ncbi:DASH family cryptochrome [Mesonia ostreae]|uniref:Cryptochrome DASH n=1 Tax=Mesonia ostreae TaxID=861110 RepID=A0ABU2KE79_9FLAO|nr:DASH family cryptochrome [Mesonia ostreae]MDT0293017.1 DASH family cryptochrome [Mesonia ostreae]